MRDAILAVENAVARFRKAEGALFDFVEFEESDPDYANSIRKSRDFDYWEAKGEVANATSELAELLVRSGQDATAVLDLRDAALFQPYRIEGIWPTVRAQLERIRIRERTNSQENKPSFLGLHPDPHMLSVTRDGRPSKAEFGSKFLPWRLFSELFLASDSGMSREELQNAVYGDKAVTPNVLDQHKRTANDVLEAIRIEIHPDNRGVWTLREI